jgi:hypothetical protein
MSNAKDQYTTVEEMKEILAAVLEMGESGPVARTCKAIVESVMARGPVQRECLAVRVSRDK